MTQETSYHTVRKGTAEGEYIFNHITADNERDAVVLRNCASFNHYIALCGTGDNFRKEGTICRSLGSFQIKAGDHVLNPAVGVNTTRVQGDASSGIPGVDIQAVNGDIVIKAESGKIRLEAQDVLINCTGWNGSTGNFNVSANNNITLDAKQSIEVESGVLVNIKCPKLVEIRGMSALNLYGGMIDFADGATSILGSKGDNPWERSMRTLSGLISAAHSTGHCD